MKNGHLVVLHTSDWHIGHILFDRKRDDEFEFFFNWLVDTIKKECVDCLLVAGDIFDTSTPSTRAQRQYLEFLIRARDQGCRHVVVTSGNHDPALLLEVHKSILERIDIHVLGMPDVENPENEVILLKDKNAQPELIVCAVPFLREKYIRKGSPGESLEDKERKLIGGIAGHYAEVAEKAMQSAGNLLDNVPLIAMGHLFAGKNIKMTQGDSERQLYVGTLGQVGTDIFSPHFDYVALGHLHLPQAVGDSEHIRYSGSPLPMSFSEAGQQKSVCLLEFAGKKPKVELLPIPEFRHLERLEGSWSAIEKRILELNLADKANGIWLDIVYTGNDHIGNLREKIDNMVTEDGLDILSIKNNRMRETILGRVNIDEELGDLDEITVLKRRLSSKNIPEGRWPDLINVFEKARMRLLEERSR